ncbi:MAG: phage protein GemA/Gp16 family protein [Candidatus Aenigmatarchaeota archaeon]
MLDRKKIALIHIIKKELNLSQELYRKILRDSVGVESAKDLDEEKFKKLMSFFVRSNYYKLNSLGLTIRQKLFIDYLANKLKWDKEHLNNFIHKYYHKSNIYELSKKEAIKLIESLKNILKHTKNKSIN